MINANDGLLLYYGYGLYGAVKYMQATPGYWNNSKLFATKVVVPFRADLDLLHKAKAR
jgi:hypothetical protein